MKRYLLRFILGLALLLMHLGYSYDAVQIELIDRLDQIAYDVKVRLTMPGGVDDRIVIIDIDERSLAEQGRWPWGRDRLALLVDKLFDTHGVSVLGFDVVFAEADNSSGLDVLKSLAEERLSKNTAYRQVFSELRPELDYDARFAAALKGRNVILGYYMSNVSEGGHTSGALPAPVLPAGTFSALGNQLAKWQTYGGNLPLLQQAAAGGGHFNPLVDFDGIFRRIPLLVSYKGEFYESLALAMVRAQLGFPEIVPGIPQGGLSMEWLEFSGLQGLKIPVDKNAAALIPFRGPQGSFPYISVTDVLNDRVAVGQLKNRFALVGTSAHGLRDLRATPVNETYSGVEAHANMIAGILDGTVKQRPEYLTAADFLQVLLSGLLLVFLLPQISPLKGTVMTLLTILLVIGLNLYLWQEAHMVLPLANVLVMILWLYALNMAWGYFIESKSKLQFTELFGQYVPPELVEEMSKDPQSYSMAGRKVELTVLFSDVRDFTSISEGMQADQLANLMNIYLGAMTEVIRKQRGTLDKYIGDAIMAFWGAPVDDPDHALHTVEAALEMQQAVTDVNHRLKQMNCPELRIGIGINTGTMTVGDMGSQVRKAYTVMGDSVNLASRLEGLTKQYGVGIIVGEATREQLGKSIVLRELDRVRVKGKAKPVGIYEPLGFKGKISQDVIGGLRQWNLALQAYRSQDWDRAEMMLSNLSAEDSHKLYELYASRVAHLRKHLPDAEWDGVTTFETK